MDFLVKVFVFSVYCFWFIPFILMYFNQFLQVHYINADKNNNIMSNLEHLCVECHSNQK